MSSGNEPTTAVPFDASVSQTGSPTDQSMEPRFFQFGERRLTSAAVFWGLMAACTIPFLIPYFYAAWNQEHFQYIPLVLVVILGLAYQRHDGIIALPQGRLTMGLLGTALAILTTAAIIPSSWLGAIAVALLTIAFLRCLRQHNGSSLVYLAIPLLLFIRLPQVRTQALIVRLQIITTDLSSVVLDFLGIPNFVQGNTISLVDRQLFVDEACSGVRSLFTLMFFALVLLVYRKRSAWLTPLMLAVAVALAVFGNLVRVTSIALAQALFGYDLATGFEHEILGHGTLLLSMLLMLSADRLIESFFHFIDLSGERDNVVISSWNYFFTPSGGERRFKGNVTGHEQGIGNNHRLIIKAVASVSVVMALVMLVSKSYAYINRPQLVADGQLLIDPKAQFFDLTEIPIEVVSHQIYRNSGGETDERLGKNADIFTCKLLGRPGEFVISQPYVGWHELTYCYQSIGWTQKLRRNVEVPNSRAVVYAQFQQTNGVHGNLFFTGINADGSLPQAYGFTRIQRWLSPFIPTILDDPAEVTGVGQTAMIQYWNVSPEPMQPKEIQKIASQMSSIRDAIAERISPTNVTSIVSSNETLSQSD